MSKQTPLDFIIAHRGASGSAPENTLTAIQKAFDLGCRWIEVDGTATADHQAVLHHDDTIDRCSDGEGLLLAKNLSDLQQQDFGSWFEEKFTGERIPTLAECAKLCGDLGIGCNMEIKVVDGWEEPTAEIVCEAIRESWPSSAPIVISSFSPEALEVAQQRLADIPRAYLATVIPRDWRQKLEATGCTALHCGDTKRLSKAAVQEVLSEGYPLRVYTVDNPLRAAELRGWGVESIFTNHPERMFAIAEL
ncbi:MAG: glycerophosphoryl diester phosphodiesterase [Granulosicoccaceae bacterium]